MSDKIRSFEHKNHMQHLVKMAPLVALFFLVESFIIKHFFPMSSDYLFVLGLSLALMLSLFVVYDSIHCLITMDDRMILKSVFSIRAIPYEMVEEVHVVEPDSAFSTLIIKTDHKNFVLYLMDDADEIKAIIERNKESKFSKKAA